MRSRPCHLVVAAACVIAADRQKLSAASQPAVKVDACDDLRAGQQHKTGKHQATIKLDAHVLRSAAALSGVSTCSSTARPIMHLQQHTAEPAYLQYAALHSGVATPVV